MATNIHSLIMRIEELSNQADSILAMPHNDIVKIRIEYQKWYSQILHLISTYLPARVEELTSFYYDTKRVDTNWYFGVRTYLDKHRADDRSDFETDIQQQKGILLAVPEILSIRALEVAALVTANLVKGELDEARLLLQHRFSRAAGAVAGVALEAHLKLLHDQSSLTYLDNDTILPLATRLRQNNVISLGDEKKCIAMADTRNKCDHKKSVDPTDDEVQELIDDVDRFTKRVQAV